MSKLRTDSIEPRLAANVDFAGLDAPTWNGIPFVLPNSPVFTGNPTAPTQADSDDSTRLATTAFVKTRADNAAAAEVTGRLATALPLMDSDPAVAGVSTNAAREDHVHPRDTSLVSSLGVSYFLNTAGAYPSLYTVPAAGTLSYIIVGGGGGGAGGGTDLTGTAGSPGVAVSGSISVTAGQTISAIVGAGGAGSASGSNPVSIPAPLGGEGSTLTISSFGTLIGNGGSAGATVPSSSLVSGFTGYTYFCADPGDSAGVQVDDSGGAANTISSRGGDRALFGRATAVGHLELASIPTALNGKDGVIGGGGGGAAPTRAFVASRGFYIDPVDGEGGDGIPTSTGGDGGTGLVYFEYQAANQPRAVTTGMLSLLKAELASQGVFLSFSPTLI